MHTLYKLDKLIRQYTVRRGVDRLQGGSISTKDHIVIGGCGRSGTTLLRVVVDSHPRICCGPESEAFLAAGLDLPLLKTRYKENATTIAEAYYGSVSRVDFIDRIAAICCAATNKPRWAEKTPRNVLHLDFLFTNFPQAKFIHVLRDGRDVACSLRTHPRHRVENGKLVELNTWKPIEQCAERWRESLTAFQPYAADPRCHTVRYEELVDDPRRTIGAMIDFLGEPWDEALLSHGDVKSIYRDATAFPQNAEANKPINKTALARWQRDLSADDKRIVKDVIGDLLIEFGYAADNDW